MFKKLIYGYVTVTVLGVGLLYWKGDPLANANPAIRFGEGCPTDAVQ
jgi:hypothetical protein